MIRALVRLGLVGLVVGWVVDQWLERRAAGVGILKTVMR